MSLCGSTGYGVWADLCSVLLYLLAATYAARLNAARMHRERDAAASQPWNAEVIRMERLARVAAPPSLPRRSDSSGVRDEVESQARAEGHGEVLQNPFEDPASVLRTSTEQTNVVSAYKPSGQYMESSGPEGHTDAIKSGGAVTLVSDAALSKPNFTTDPSTLVSTANDDVEEDTGLRSGDVDELSVIAEVSSCEEREAGKGA